MQIYSLFRAIRPLNLVMVAVGQVLTFYFLYFEADPQDLLHKPLWALVIATLCIAAAGNVVNDLLDRGADLINKPHKNVFQNGSPRRWGWGFYVLLNGMGLYLAFLLSIQFFLIFTIIAILLLWYSHYLKGLPLVGNILVSLIAGYSILVVYQFFSVQTPSLVYAYAGFAFLFTLLRELVKDIQDAEGDQEVGYFTLPVRIGTTRSLSVFKGLLIFTLVAFVQIQIELVQTYFQAPLQWIFIAYLLICVVAPMFYVLYLVVVKPKEVDFSELSWMIKYILATGILSMMFY